MHTRKGSPSSSIILVYEQWVGVTRNKKTPQREELYKPRGTKDRISSIWEQKDTSYLWTLPMLMPTRNPTIRQEGKIRKQAIKSWCVSQRDVMSAYNGRMSIRTWLICGLRSIWLTRAAWGEGNEQLFFPFYSLSHAQMILSGHSHGSRHSFTECNKSDPHSHSGWDGRDPVTRVGEGLAFVWPSCPPHFPPGLLFILWNSEKASCLSSGWRPCLPSWIPRGCGTVGGTRRVCVWGWESEKGKSV